MLLALMDTSHCNTTKPILNLFSGYCPDWPEWNECPALACWHRLYIKLTLTSLISNSDLPKKIIKKVPTKWILTCTSQHLSHICSMAELCHWWPEQLNYYINHCCQLCKEGRTCECLTRIKPYVIREREKKRECARACAHKWTTELSLWPMAWEMWDS